MLTPTVRRTYAPRGQTPILYGWDRRDRVSAISAITVSPKRKRLNLYCLLLPDNENVHAEDIVTFLRMLKRHIPRPLTILWDRHNIHDRSSVVQRYLDRHSEIKTEKFPAYAPELNPDEQIWNHTKYKGLANFVPKDTKELKEQIAIHLRKLRSRKDLLASFVRHSGLGIKVG